MYDQIIKNLNNYIIEEYNQKWISEDIAKKYLGFKKTIYSNDDPNFKQLDKITKYNNEENKSITYIKLNDGLNNITKNYNRRNPELINLHREIGFYSDDYSIESITLNPIVNYLADNNIYYELQTTISSLERRIDLFIVNYNIAIECDENDHIDRDIIDEELRIKELESLGITTIKYNPYDKNYDSKIIIKKIEEEIKRIKISISMKTNNYDDLTQALKEYNETNLETQYYNLFGESLIGQNGFCVYFDVVYKMCGYSKIDKGKDCLVKNFTQNVDFIVKKKEDVAPFDSGAKHNKEFIFLTKECFKMFCMICGTEEGKKIRTWYIKMEMKYVELLMSQIVHLSNKYENVIQINKNKTVQTSLENKKYIKEKKIELKQKKIIDSEKINKPIDIINKPINIINEPIDIINKPKNSNNIVNINKNNIVNINKNNIVNINKNNIEQENNIDVIKNNLFKKFITEIFKICEPTKIINFNEIIFTREKFDKENNSKYKNVVDLFIEEIKKVFGSKEIDYSKRNIQTTYTLQLLLKMASMCGYKENKKIIRHDKTATTQYILSK